MSEVTGLGAYGIYPFMSEDVFKQARYDKIKTRAGKIAYILSLGERAQKPVVEEGVDKARGALKWIDRFIKEKEEL